MATSNGRLNVYITPETHKRVKVFAALTDQSVSAVVEKALKEHLDKEEKHHQR